MYSLIANMLTGSPLAAVITSSCTYNGQNVPCSQLFHSYGSHGSVDPAQALLFIPLVLIILVLIVIVIISWWKIFKKAGKPGWAAIVPIYNNIVMLEITAMPIWLIFLMFVPLANYIMMIVIMYRIAQAFGKGIGFTIGLILLPMIFLPILAFSNASYMKPTESASF